VLELHQGRQAGHALLRYGAHGHRRLRVRRRRVRVRPKVEATHQASVCAKRNLKAGLDVPKLMPKVLFYEPITTWHVYVSRNLHAVVNREMFGHSATGDRGHLCSRAKRRDDRRLACVIWPNEPVVAAKRNLESFKSLEVIEAQSLDHCVRDSNQHRRQPCVARRSTSGAVRHRAASALRPALPCLLRGRLRPQKRPQASAAAALRPPRPSTAANVGEPPTPTPLFARIFAPVRPPSQTKNIGAPRFELGTSPTRIARTGSLVSTKHLQRRGFWLHMSTPDGSMFPSI
jgi:hypothetical protein